MTAVTVIGTGTMGQAIAALAVRAGASIQLLGRDARKTAAVADLYGAAGGMVGDEVTGDIVVFAVPYFALAELALAYNGRLSGAVVVDITNPINDQTQDGLVVPPDSSAAAQLAMVLPKARIVKAFNTNNASTLLCGEFHGAPTVVQVASDDEEAKTVLSEVITAAGLIALDAGPLKRARELEAFGFLQLALATRHQIAHSGGFAVVR